MLEVPQPGGLCQGELLTGTEAKKEKCVARGKARGSRSSEEALTADPELQSLESALSGFCLALARQFLAMPPVLSFGMATYEHICAVPLYVGPMSFAFLFYRELQLRECLKSQKRL